MLIRRLSLCAWSSPFYCTLACDEVFAVSEDVPKMTPTYPQEDRDRSFFLVVSGQAQFLANWTRFKDHLQDNVENQPGWANVFDNQRQGKVQGWASLKNGEDAVTALSMCSSATCSETCN